ncbi:response regulator receiver protein [Hyalangium minutum]|uniref:histidine kinase n=1 Tax=Hyalangium minutum TaxID=394096 RepID=A0A085WC49_9BACT|nr:response regulator receiver protein [Hyalangium minutum]
MLIVDDDTASRSTVAALLSPLRYRLRFAASGEEALASVEEEIPDLVLMDVMMPGLDGFEVCRRMRALLQEVSIPIVLVTALDARKDIVRGLEAGADDFLPKPVHGAELRARVRNLLKVRAYYQLLATQRDSALATVDVLRQQVLQADRLATLGTFAAGVSHELNNIAQVLRSALESPFAPRDGSAEARADVQSNREALTHVSNHLTELARTILRIARPTGAELQEADLCQTLREVRDMLRLTGRTRHAQVVLVLPQQPCRIRANPVHAQQVFLNLISNAADAVVDAPSPFIEAGVQAGPEGRLEAWVRDNGPGIPSELRTRIFEPFFTTKPVGAGTGLGLPVVKQIVESWGGKIHVQESIGRGTRMVIDLPVAPASASPRASP